MFTIRRKKHERGATLAEFAMYITLAIIVIASAFWAYQNANTGRNTNQAITDLASLQNAVRSLYANAPHYGNLDVVDMIAAQSIPRRLVIDTGSETLSNSFNGNTTIEPEDINGVTDAGFSIEITNVPGESCVRLGTLDLGSGMVALDIDPDGTGSQNNWDINDFPLDLSDVQDPCGDSTSTMLWTFR